MSLTKCTQIVLRSNIRDVSLDKALATWLLRIHIMYFYNALKVGYVITSYICSVCTCVQCHIYT